MTHRLYDDDRVYDESASTQRLSPVAPAVIWGVIAVAAVASASATVWRATLAPEQRLVSVDENAGLRRDVARLGAERDELAGRLAALERGVGDIRLAQRATEPATTGSVQRPRDQPGAKFGLSLGIESSLDAAKRRWTALTARYPQQLSKLSPRVQRDPGATPMFDLVVGPFASREEADRICGALAEQGLACDTTDYVGDPIGRS